MEARFDGLGEPSRRRVLLHPRRSHPPKAASQLLSAPGFHAGMQVELLGLQPQPVRGCGRRFFPFQVHLAFEHCTVLPLVDCAWQGFSLGLGFMKLRSLISQHVRSCNILLGCRFGQVAFPLDNVRPQGIAKRDPISRWRPQCQTLAGAFPLQANAIGCTIRDAESDHLHLSLHNLQPSQRATSLDLLQKVPSH